MKSHTAQVGALTADKAELTKQVEELTKPAKHHPLLWGEGRARQFIKPGLSYVPNGTKSGVGIDEE